MALSADLTQPELLGSPAHLEAGEKRLRTLPDTPIISLSITRNREAPDAGHFRKSPETEFAFIVQAQKSREETLNDNLIILYLICAVLGSTVLVGQFLLGLLGLGHHHDLGGFEGHEIAGHDGHAEHPHDADQDAHATGFVRLLTFRSIVAAVAFFGLGGRVAGASGLDPALTLVVAAATGGGALFLVAWLMRALVRLQSDGAVRIGRAVGRGGTVYLPIPGHKSGVGKVMLNVQNRTMEYQAVTDQDALPTGAKVVVVAVVGSDTVEVVSAPPAEKGTHV